jgi:hypothetical protein
MEALEQSWGCLSCNWWLKLGFSVMEALGQNWDYLRGNWWSELGFWVMEALEHILWGVAVLGCRNRVLAEGKIGADLRVV